MPVFTANIPGVLKIGDRIEIGGKIKENARKMSVNLCAQEGEEPKDVVLHFDVRFHRDNIISLSRKNGVWIGSGNLDTNYNMFVPGTVFRIVFEVKDTDVITIYCQGKFHSNFLPKIPLNMAKFLVAWADVERITHCYFRFAGLGEGDDEDIRHSPRPGIQPIPGNDAKRCTKMKKQTAPDSIVESNESSDDDHKAHTREAHIDRYNIYDTLMCQRPTIKMGSPQSLKCKKGFLGRGKPEHKHYKHSDSERVESDLSEGASRNDYSSVGESEEAIVDAKKRMRRGKFAPFSHVVNLMERSRRKS
ncbi:uncharacterized protein LOC121739860 [Aricia agestis]|uniref:uncharacterized protein LOC121739860 n=1 Tax=Aricia agestis TaxID=91739 RepID=UPI001C20B255|nr:uncharacterized protein LOC121739860 [Aricia agestis]XP_041988384.1 uncharacterized protein LOC121739860 [Aricia agestis]